MNELWEFYLSKMWVEPFLTGAVVVFIMVSILLYLLIIKSRSGKLTDEIISARQTQIIERILFAVIFGNVSFAEIKDDAEYKSLCSNKRFRDLLATSVLNLHQNYEGVYAKKLERFYYESGLIRDSFKKMKSPKWEIVCCGVKELAEMNVTKAFGSIIKISQKGNKTVKVVALTACIKLHVEKGLQHLVYHKDPIDEWIQINILSVIKLYDVEDIKGVELLFESRNATVVSLALKIIKTLKLSAKAHYVSVLAAGDVDPDIKFEAQQVLNSLNL